VSNQNQQQGQLQIKFEVQIYKVRDGEYCIDIQVTPLNQLQAQAMMSDASIVLYITQPLYCDLKLLANIDPHYNISGGIIYDS